MPLNKETKPTKPDMQILLYEQAVCKRSIQTDKGLFEIDGQ